MRRRSGRRQCACPRGCPVLLGWPRGGHWQGSVSACSGAGLRTRTQRSWAPAGMRCACWRSTAARRVAVRMQETQDYRGNEASAYVGHTGMYSAISFTCASASFKIEVSVQRWLPGAGGAGVHVPKAANVCGVGADRRHKADKHKAANACRTAQVVPVCVPELELTRVSQLLTIGAELRQAHRAALLDPARRRRLQPDTRVTLACAARFSATDLLQACLAQSRLWVCKDRGCVAALSCDEKCICGGSG